MMDSTRVTTSIEDLRARAITKLRQKRANKILSVNNMKPAIGNGGSSNNNSTGAPSNISTYTDDDVNGINSGLNSTLLGKLKVSSSLRMLELDETLGSSKKQIVHSNSQEYEGLRSSNSISSMYGFKNSKVSSGTRGILEDNH